MTPATLITLMQLVIGIRFGFTSSTSVSDIVQWRQEVMQAQMCAEIYLADPTVQTIIC
jgi:hypothetical protein